ncbi:heparin lyase I family protein [Paenibacillus sp. LHD-117]|uniref:heparin lyase I family protein n=1 Tax=Paenibacillus sp. LHD-117 TaxID=3071412 RepID=UPI0027E0B3C7|nr:heparin lyase I family protein [Paenibacillus sp. LHD-117]MDQ6419834.1 heparin lyase I family protein [Paenibacillus sp. LHD-117]
MKKSYKVAAALTLASVFAASTVYAATVTINSDGPNSGSSPLAIFQQYLGSDPVDGPTDSGHLYESTSSYVGNVFMFKAGTESDTAVLDGSNTDRQRIEVKAYKGSPSNVTATNGQTTTYKWQFRAMSPYPMPPSGNFHHIFQLKAVDGDDGYPVLTFSLDNGYLKFRHNPVGTDTAQLSTLAQTEFSNVDGQWVEATVTVKHTDSGSINMALKLLDGTTLMSYSGTRDNWRDGATINRPKWGIYRKLYSGMPEAKIQFANFQITE